MCTVDCSIVSSQSDNATLISNSIFGDGSGIFGCVIGDIKCSTRDSTNHTAFSLNASYLDVASDNIVDDSASATDLTNDTTSCVTGNSKIFNCDIGNFDIRAGSESDDATRPFGLAKRSILDCDIADL